MPVPQTVSCLVGWASSPPMKCLLTVVQEEGTKVLTPDRYKFKNNEELYQRIFDQFI